jgi:DNA-3-methyladenine glycosylase I
MATAPEMSPSIRCFGDGSQIYEDYHDFEWGRPVVDERGLYERLCLEGLQSGLSWLIILRKRDGLRDAFSGFHPDAVAGYHQDDIDRFMADARVIRNRRKIEAIITNARATIGLRDGIGLSKLLWAYASPLRSAAPKTFDDVPSADARSTDLAKKLKASGFRFVGPTTVYATMQAVGLVNDHLRGCSVRAEVKVAQQAARKQMHALPTTRGR